MNLNQLRIFFFAARWLNFSQAGKELGVSESTVSVQLRRFEKKIGVELIEQIGKRLYLTEPGRRLLEYADRIFALERDAELMLNNYRDHDGNLKIGVSTDLGTYYLPMMLFEFAKLFPDLQVTMQVGNSAWVKEQIIKNSVDIAIVSGDMPDTPFGVIPFLPDELVVIAAPHHHLAGKKLRAIDLSGQPFILRERESNTRKVFQRVMLDRDLHINVFMELESTEAIKRLVSSGTGLSVVSTLALEWELSSGQLTILNIADLRLERDSSLVWHKDKNRTKSMRAFADFAYRYASNHRSVIQSIDKTFAMGYDTPVSNIRVMEINEKNLQFVSG